MASLKVMRSLCAGEVGGLFDASEREKLCGVVKSNEKIEALHVAWQGVCALVQTKLHFVLSMRHTDRLFR